MVAEASLSAIGYFTPIFAFLLVFIVIYALLTKTKVLGESESVKLFISFVLASFFIVQINLVEFVKFSSAWFGVIVVGLFFLLVVLAFLPGKAPLDFLTKNNWFSFVMLGLIVVFFIISSAYVFNWVINWGTVQDWFSSDWFGMVLLLIIAAIVSWKIKS